MLYSYFAVGIFSAMLMEYQVHFYSSGAIEEDWRINDLSDNLLAVSLGSILGSLITIALLASERSCLPLTTFFRSNWVPCFWREHGLMARKCSCWLVWGCWPASVVRPSKRPYRGLQHLSVFQLAVGKELACQFGKGLYRHMGRDVRARAWHCLWEFNRCG